MKTRGKRAAADALKMLKARPGYDKHDARSNVVDAMADLRFYCTRNNIDFEDCAESGLSHFRAESHLDARNAHRDEA